jgi:hypothetical protein
MPRIGITLPSEFSKPTALFLIDKEKRTQRNAQELDILVSLDMLYNAIHTPHKYLHGLNIYNRILFYEPMSMTFGTLITDKPIQEIDFVYF